MKSKEIAEMTTNFTLGDFMIYPGLTESTLIGKRKSAARPMSHGGVSLVTRHLAVVTAR